MFKVFRIKEEHSAFLSDGGGNGSRGLACVSPHHVSPFSRSPTVCLSLSPCSSSRLPSLSTCLLYRTLSLSPRLCVFVNPLSLGSFFIASRYLSCLLHLSPSYLLSSIHLLYPSLSLSIQFYHLCGFLSSSFLPPFTCASYSPPVSFISRGGP